MNNKQAQLIKDVPDRVLIMNVWLTQGIVLLIAVVLTFFLFDKIRDFQSLFQWMDPNILFIGFLVGLVVVFIDLLMMRVLPPSYYDDGGINERIFSCLSYVHIFFLTAAVSICEELLFRGAIQTYTTIWIASAIFALVHYRYLFHPYLFINVVLLSFLFGWIYEYTGNLLVTISMHFTIDFLLGLYIKWMSTKQKQDTQNDYSESE
ncbi:CPBP family intramembrane glutamic endopeptidase [Bacillus sp. 1P06AnD]|uniref:CPBP family intramembrane glutamic endopeptidase n=1 Tax=Bacillus sp. 1P06AnD TaxID=3132208 RepID=UPI0039A1F14F